MLKIKGLSQEEVSKLIPHDPVLVGYCGSIAHGTYRPSKEPNSIDDKDVMAVSIAPLSNYFGLDHWQGGKNKFLREWDVTTYEFKRFVELLLKSNPNVLGMLWLEEKDYIYVDHPGKVLIQNRDLFVSLRAYHSFTGYAYSQLKRMKGGSYEGYMGEKRKRLVDKHGYDTKNASHLIRLLRMGIEFLKEGQLHVQREDSAQLLEIKDGKWSMEKVEREADRLFKLAEEAYTASKLPPEPDRKGASDMLEDLLEGWFCGQR